MLKSILRFVLPILLGLSLGILLIVIFEESFIYFPAKYPEGNWQPETYGLKAEECWFETTDGVGLHGWFFRVDTPRATILWCHGNAGNITHRLDNIRKLINLDVNIFIFDYRGYGRSQGKPSEDGLYRDAEAAYEFLRTKMGVAPSSMIIFGRSLGAAVAVDLASKQPNAGVILESAFTSASDVAWDLAPFLPVAFFLRSKFNAVEKIQSIHTPILFTHGTDDRTIPLNLGKKLFEAANKPKWFYPIEGADHNDTYLVGGRAYFDRISEFIDTVAVGRKAFRIGHEGATE